MAVSDILLLGNPLLYGKSEPVKREEIADLQSSFNLMFETVVDFREKYGSGRAIAAPQIGLLKRIICMNTDKPIVMINPEIICFGEEMFELWDDCMSFPNLLVKVRRHKHITLTFFDVEWQKHTWHLENDMAELMQHEYDHLDGILATQRAIDNRSFRWKK
jgi:peptide deformylase